MPHDDALVPQPTRARPFTDVSDSGRVGELRAAYVAVRRPQTDFVGDLHDAGRAPVAEEVRACVVPC
jgi:hypothetical protein